jgi:protein-L-isoaspartate(D-aspartate) O-methyltransferase
VMDFAARRAKMVEDLRGDGYLRSDAVIAAMGKVERHLFVPDEMRESAYEDCPQPIGFNQTISAPHMVAIMTELLDVQPASRILEIGTGSGYQAAILSELAHRGKVVTVERVPELVEHVRKVFSSGGYVNVDVRIGDGSLGFPEYAPYDRIIVTAAAPAVPPSLVRQLGAGGRLLVPVGDRWGQVLVELEKDCKGESVGRSHGGCVFVPLIGKDGW